MSSSTATFSSTAAASPSSSGSSPPTQGNPGSNLSSSDQANTFYKNLFYILIGLLVAFGLISFLSLMRARRRRRAIIREANRLGLIVPGRTEYVPFRERQDMKYKRVTGVDSPSWWEVGSAAWKEHTVGQGGGGGQSSSSPYSRGLASALTASTSALAAGAGAVAGARLGAGAGSVLMDLPNDLGQASDFRPLAVVAPPPEVPKTEDKPVSALPFFPNHLAYQPESLAPFKQRFRPDSLDPEAVTALALAGKSVKVAVLLKMPVVQKPEGELEENEEVLREWEGVQLGIASVPVDREHSLG